MRRARVLATVILGLWATIVYVWVLVVASKSEEPWWLRLWRASGGVRAPATALAVPNPPPTWSVPSWFVDPQNVTGCASDTATTCQSATCTGNAGPCLTYAIGVTNKLNCVGSPRGCPMLQNTFMTVKYLSTPTQPDPVLAFPVCVGTGSGMRFTADLPTPSRTATLSSVTQWNGSCASSRWNTAATNIGVPGALIQDTTIAAHPTAWCNALSSTTECDITIPNAQITQAPPFNFPTPGLYTSATGGAGTIGGTDNVQEWDPGTLTGIDLVDVEPIVEGWNTSYDAGSPEGGAFQQSACVYVDNVRILDPNGTGKDPIQWGPGVLGYQLEIDRIYNLTSNASTHDDGCVNCNYAGGVSGGRLSTGHYTHLNGGLIPETAPLVNVTGLGVALDGWISLRSTATFVQGVSIGLLYMKNASAAPNLGGMSTIAAITPGYGSVQNGVQVCAGSVPLNLVGNARVGYDSSHGGISGILNLSTGVTFNGQTTACSLTLANPAVETCAITWTTSAQDGAVDATHFGGRAYGAFGALLMANTP